MKRHYKIATWSACCMLVLLTVACSQQQPTPDTRAADEATIRQADIAWSKAAAAKDVDAMVAYYADDASLFRDQAPIVTGKEAIRSSWEDWLKPPGFSIHWQPTKVEVARSGDLAYLQGTYESTMSGPKGNPVADQGKYLVVWKKQSNGSWKAVADIANSDLSPATPLK